MRNNMICYVCKEKIFEKENFVELRAFEFNGPSPEGTKIHLKEDWNCHMKCFDNFAFRTALTIKIK